MPELTPIVCTCQIIVPSTPGWSWHHRLVLLSLLDIAIFIVTLHVQLNVLTGRPLSGAITLLLPRRVDQLNMEFLLDFPKIFVFSVSVVTLGVPCLYVTFFFWAAGVSLMIH